MKRRVGRASENLRESPPLALETLSIKNSRRIGASRALHSRGMLIRQAPLVSNCVAESIPNSAEIDSGGARWVQASSFDVLGLGTDLRVREAAAAALRRFGAGDNSGASLREEFEAALERRYQRGPVAVVQALAPQMLGDCVVQFRSHALMPNAVRVHSPVDADRLFEVRAPFALWVEAVHPFEGDLELLPQYAQVCERRGTALLAFDACGLGVLGEAGLGVVDHFGMEEMPGLTIVQLGKAIPGSGVVVFGSGDIVKAARDALDLPTAPDLAASLRALEIAAAEPHRRSRSLDLAERLLQTLHAYEFDTGPCVTPWIPVWAGEIATAEAWLGELAEARISARALLVPGAARLHFALPASLSDAQFELLARALKRVANRSDFVPRKGAQTILARPGSFATSAPCDPRWQLAPPELIDATGDVREPLPLRQRFIDVIETMTWRAVNASGRKVQGASRALVTLRKRRSRSN